MAKDNNKPDAYPQPGENNKRWKQQDKFDLPTPQRQLEDEEKNCSIAPSAISSSKNDSEKKGR